MDGRDEIFRRIQIGAVGIVAVLLMVSLASLVISGNDANRDAPPSGGATTLDERLSEPLAELGAQPTLDPEQAATPAPAATNAPVRDLEPRATRAANRP